METKKRILLYGNSLILGSVKASLQRCSQFEVTTLVPHLSGAQNLDLINPDILIFDLDTTHTEAVFSILKTHPSLLLIGISPDINLVKIWSGRQMRELSTQSLFELIDREVNHMRVKSGGKKDPLF